MRGSAFAFAAAGRGRGWWVSAGSLATGVLQTQATLVDLVIQPVGGGANFDGDVEQCGAVAQSVGHDGFEEGPQ